MDLNKSVEKALKAVPADANVLLFSIIDAIKRAESDKSDRRVTPRAPTLKTLTSLIKYVGKSENSSRTRRWAACLLLCLVNTYPAVKQQMSTSTSLRACLADLVLGAKEELMLLGAALAAQFYPEKKHIDTIWPTTTYPKLKTRDFPRDIDVEKWYERVRNFVDRDTDDDGAPTRDPSFIAPCVAIGDELYQPEDRLLCIVTLTRLVVTPTHPTGDTPFYLEVLLASVLQVVPGSIMLMHDTGSQEAAPSLTILFSDGPPHNCVFNSSYQKYDRVTLILNDANALAAASKKLRKAVEEVDEVATQISEVGLVVDRESSEDQAYDEEERVPDSFGDAVAQDGHAQRRKNGAFQRDDDDGMELSVTPIDTAILAEQQLLGEMRSSLRSKNAEAADETAEDAAPDLETAGVEPRVGNEPDKRHVQATDKQLKLTTTSANVDGPSALSRTTKAWDGLIDEDLAGPRAGLRPRKTPVSTAAPKEPQAKKPAAPANSSRVLRHKNVQQISASNTANPSNASAQPQAAAKTTKSGKLPQKMVKDTEKGNEDIWDIPSSGHGSNHRNKKPSAKLGSTQAAKSKATPEAKKSKLVPSIPSSSSDLHTKESDDELLSTLSRGSGVVKTYKTAGKPRATQAKKSNAVPQPRTRAQAAIESLKTKNVDDHGDQLSAGAPSAVSQPNMRLSGIQVPENDEPEPGPFDDFEAQVVDYDPPMAGPDHGDREEIASALPASTAKSAPKASVTEGPVPSSTTPIGNKGKNHLINENIVKKKGIVSFGPKGPKNQASTRMFESMLDDEVDARAVTSSAANELQAVAHSSIKKLRSAASKTANQVPLSSTRFKRPDTTSATAPSSSARKRAQPNGEPQARRKKQKLSQEDIENHPFVPIDDVQAATGVPAPVTPKPKAAPRRVLTNITEEGSPSLQAKQAPVARMMKTPQVYEDADVNVPPSTSDGVWAQLSNARSQTNAKAHKVPHEPNIREHSRAALREIAPDMVQSSPPEVRATHEPEDMFSGRRAPGRRPSYFERQLRSATSKNAEPQSANKRNAEVKARLTKLRSQETLANAAGEAFELSEEPTVAPTKHKSGVDVALQVDPLDRADKAVQVDMMEVDSGSSDAVKPRAEIQDKTPEEKWEDALQPRHRSLLTKLNGISRQFLVQIMNCEDALFREVDDYFSKGNGILQKMDEKHIQQLQELQRKKDDPLLARSAEAKTLAAMQKEHGKVRGDVRGQLKAWKKADDAKALQLKKLQAIAEKED